MIRLLFVDDDPGDTASIEYYARDHATRLGLSVRVFGPREAKAFGEGCMVERLVKAFQSKGGTGLSLSAVDVIISDFTMAPMNADGLIELLGRHFQEKAPPVVVMGAHPEAFLDDGVHLLDLGLKGYISARKNDNPRFWQEIQLTSYRVFNDRQRGRWTRALSKIASHIHNHNCPSDEDFIQGFVNKLGRELPGLRLFVRLADRNDSTLRLAGWYGISRRQIRSLQLENFPMEKFAVLKGALTREKPLRFNDLATLEDETSANTLKLLGIGRGMVFRLKGNSRTALGIMTFLRGPSDPPFTDVELGFAQTVVDLLSLTQRIADERTRQVEVMHLWDKLANAPNEEEIYARLTEHLHKHVNGQDVKSLRHGFKATFKVRRPGSNKLSTEGREEWHYGALRPRSIEHDLEAEETSRTSVSVKVFRTRCAELISDVRKEGLYKASNAAMRSELCVPVMPAKVSDTVYGVVNLEAAIINYYRPEDLEYVTKLCRIAGLHVQKCKTELFLNKMLEVLSQPGGKAERAEKRLEHRTVVTQSFKLLKELTGYSVLMFVERDRPRDGRWQLVEVDGVLEDRRAEFREEIESRLNGPSDSKKPLLLKAVLDNPGEKEQLHYFSSLTEDPHLNPALYVAEGDTRSQAVMVLRKGAEIMAAVSLDFPTKDPLTQHQQSLVEHLARLLGILIGSRSLADAMQRLTYQQFAVNVGHKGKDLLRMMQNVLHGLRSILLSDGSGVECPRGLSDDTKTYIATSMDTLEKVAAGYLQLQETVRTLARRRHMAVRIDGERIVRCWVDNVEKLADKAKAARATVSSDLQVDGSIEFDFEELSLIFEMLLRNAIEACGDDGGGRVWTEVNESGTGIIIGIRDTGPGFPDNFSISERAGASGKREGAGLGLAYVQDIMSHFGGELRLPKGRGDRPTCVQLVFPVENGPQSSKSDEYPFCSI